MNRASRIGILCVSVAIFCYAGIGHVLGRTPDDKAYKSLTVYGEVLQKVQQDYVDDPNMRTVTAGSLQDRKSTRLNSSHLVISYAVFCLKKKNHTVLKPEFSAKNAGVKQDLVWNTRRQSPASCCCRMAMRNLRIGRHIVFVTLNPGSGQ